MSYRAATVHAQAKINLFLRVLAREASGYHQIETLFCRLALGDTVRVRITPGPRTLDVVGAAVPASGLGPTEHNLAWRAAEAFRAAIGWPAGFVLEIEKRIPVGAGLGGGSADAGAVLRALNALAPAPLPTSALIQLAGTLGADVPFMTQDVSTLAFGFGRGDRLVALPALPIRPCFVIWTGIHVATREAYGWLSASPEHPSGAACHVPDRFTSWDEVARQASNVFERVVFEEHPVLGERVHAIRSSPDLVDLALLSGSGGSFFVLPRHGVQWSGDPWGSTLATTTSDQVSPVELTEP